MNTEKPKISEIMPLSGRDYATLPNLDFEKHERMLDEVIEERSMQAVPPTVTEFEMLVESVARDLRTAVSAHANIKPSSIKFRPSGDPQYRIINYANPDAHYSGETPVSELSVQHDCSELYNSAVFSHRLNFGPNLLSEDLFYEDSFCFGITLL